MSSMIFQNFAELHLNLSLHVHCLEDYLKTIGTEIKNNRYFIVTDDGNCWIIDLKTFNALFTEKDCIADGKIKALVDIPKDIHQIKIPDGVIAIGYAAFSGCSYLTSIVIPDKVKIIGINAFNYCTSLMHVTIPDSVTRIEMWAFDGCTNLMSATIPYSVKSIGNGAFYNCSSLKNLIFKDKTLNEVKHMEYYPWGIEDESIITVQ